LEFIVGFAISLKSTRNYSPVVNFIDRIAQSFGGFGAEGAEIELFLLLRNRKYWLELFYSLLTNLPPQLQLPHSTNSPTTNSNSTPTPHQL
jgi:hypothetical protein